MQGSLAVANCSTFLRSTRAVKHADEQARAPSHELRRAPQCAQSGSPGSASRSASRANTDSTDALAATRRTHEVWRP